MEITFFHRKNLSDKSSSIDILFDRVSKELSNTYSIKKQIAPYYSQGIMKRIGIAVDAYFHQSDINHITGDIHFIAMMLKKSKTILTVHDCNSILNSSGLKKLILKYFWFTLPAKRVSYITTVSQKTKHELLEIINFEEDKIIVIPNCISNDFIFIQKSFNNTKPTILNIGTGTNKNLLRLCQALETIACKLMIVGSPSKEQIEMLAECNINYEVFVNLDEAEILDLYRKSDILTFASTYEGFGMPIIEAQAIGTPVVTSNIEPMNTVADKGACLVDPYDYLSIRHGIEKIIADSNYRNQLISYGLINAKRYAPKIISEQYAALYERVYCEYMSE